jgi:hypothetical protein
MTVDRTIQSIPDMCWTDPASLNAPAWLAAERSSSANEGSADDETGASQTRLVEALSGWPRIFPGL